MAQTFEESMSQWEGQAKSIYGSVLEFVEKKQKELGEIKVEIEKAELFALGLQEAVVGEGSAAEVKQDSKEKPVGV